jgi:hypothetical protein
VSGEQQLDFWLGHDVDRYVAVAQGPILAPGERVAYGCQHCDCTTDWFEMHNEGLAVDLIRQHQLRDCPPSLAAGPLQGAIRPPDRAGAL